MNSKEHNAKVYARNKLKPGWAEKHKVANREAYRNGPKWEGTTQKISDKTWESEIVPIDNMPPTPLDIDGEEFKNLDLFNDL
jgi:hypothetical protein